MNSTSLGNLRALSLVSAKLEVEYATQFFYHDCDCHENADRDCDYNHYCDQDHEAEPMIPYKSTVLLIQTTSKYKIDHCECFYIMRSITKRIVTLGSVFYLDG